MSKLSLNCLPHQVLICLLPPKRYRTVVAKSPYTHSSSMGLRGNSFGLIRSKRVARRICTCNIPLPSLYQHHQMLAERSLCTCVLPHYLLFKLSPIPDVVVTVDTTVWYLCVYLFCFREIINFCTLLFHVLSKRYIVGGNKKYK